MNLIPFESANVPAALAAMFPTSGSDLVGTASSGYPYISIKGKVFHIVRGDEKTLVTKPGEDDPSSSIEVVIVRANPARSKVFYKTGYVEGSTEKPDCYSTDGKAPGKDAVEPQCKTCAACPHNIWGSKVSESGALGRSCTDSRRIAIAMVGVPGDPMLLRVPAASMAAMESYGKQLAARNVPPEAVVTRIGFDYSVAHPALTFKPISFIGDAAALVEIRKARELEVTKQIIGLVPDTGEVAAAAPAAAVGEDPAVAAAVAATEQRAKAAKAAEAEAARVAGEQAAAAAAEKAAKAKAAKAAKAAADKAAAEQAAANSQIEDAVEVAVKTADTTEKVTVKVATGGSTALEDEIANMLGDLDFDN